MDIRQDLILSMTDSLPGDGKASGYIKIPFSSNSSAYGFIPLPFATIGPTGGPTALLMAGSYGDETESQAAVTRVARALNPERMQGRVIILPMANQPAAENGTRNSPIDGGNLNRSFPGDVFGPPTSIIADYIERHVMPECDIVLDIHTRGDSFSYLPSATMLHHAAPDERAKRIAVALAFGAPQLLVFHSYDERTSSGASKRAGAVRIGVESSGPSTVQGVFDGVMNVLEWGGILSPLDRPAAIPAAMPDVCQTSAEADYVYALHDGIFEPTVALGDAVQDGDRAGYIHDPSRPLQEPKDVFFRASGKVVCTRGARQCRRGDCLMHLASPADAQLAAEVEVAADSRWLADQFRRRRPK